MWTARTGYPGNKLYARDHPGEIPNQFSNHGKVNWKPFSNHPRQVYIRSWNRDFYRFTPSQWKTVLLCNDVSHWLGTNLESALLVHIALVEHIEEDTKWLVFCRRYFGVRFIRWKYMYVDLTELCSFGSNWQLGIIGSGNGLVTNQYCQLHERTNTSPGFNEL